jgi:hypothetical protein
MFTGIIETTGFIKNMALMAELTVFLDRIFHFTGTKG